MKNGDEMTSTLKKEDKINKILEKENKLASRIEEDEWTKTDTKITITVASIFAMFAFIFIPNPLKENLYLMTITPS